MVQNYRSIKNHRETQETYWREFCKQLEQLKDKERGLSINYEELAKGLGISRQRLHQFIREPERGLSIDRANILELWDHLTEAETLDEKEISQEARKNRDKLRMEESSTLDALLKAAGFLPTSQMIDKTTPQIERVKRRLASSWISSSSVLSKITDSIIDTILDQGGLAKGEKEKAEEDGYSAAAARSWPRKNVQDIDLNTAENFDREITRFENLGKVRFYDNELFELYQSISENHILKNFDVLARITDCQFKTLTFSLIDEFEKLEIKEEEIKDRLSKVCNQCEQGLRSSNQSLSRIGDSNNEFIRFPPVIEASVTLSFKSKSGSLRSKNLVLKYASSATHIENMLIALSNGMGYLLSGTLEVTGFFIRAIGRRSDSLARASISLSEHSQSKNVYQGLWVEGNAIVGVLQAFLFASLNWLSEKITPKNIPGFFKVCEDMSNLDQKLSECLDKVYNYSYTYSYLTDNETIKELELTEEGINRQADVIETLAKSSQFQDLMNNKLIKGYYETYKERLAMKRFLASLARTHASIVRSDVKQAGIHLHELKKSLYMGDLQISSNENFTPIFILHNSERMFYNLLRGESDFIKYKEWRNPMLDQSLESAVQKLRDYIINKKAGVIDTDVYLATTQLYGITGLVEFYVCQKEDTGHLERAVDSFLSAAYYSSKIGHSQRAARALCHASRTCCRLGHQEMAKQIVKVVYDLIDISSRSQFSLAEGEILLRFGKSESDLYKALFHFLHAWESSTDKFYSGNKLEERRFFRSNIDSLYDICRLFSRLGEINSEGTYKPFEEISKFLESEEGKILFGDKGHQNADLLKRFKVEYELESSATCILIAERIQKETILGWNSCCGADRTQHPFSTLIKDGKFLEDCDIN